MFYDEFFDILGNGMLDVNGDEMIDEFEVFMGYKMLEASSEDEDPDLYDSEYVDEDDEFDYLDDEEEDEDFLDDDLEDF